LEFLTAQLAINILTNFISTLRNVAAKVENLSVLNSRGQPSSASTSVETAKNDAGKSPKMKVLRI
jgi:hypothetical protein